MDKIKPSKNEKKNIEKKNNKKYVNVGIEIQNDRKNKKEFELRCKEPWFTLIKSGLKKIDGRVCHGIITEMRKGDVITLISKRKNNNELKEEKHKVKIHKIVKYPTFKELLFEEKYFKVFPGFPSFKCAKEVYENLYKFPLVKKNGVVAIHFE